MSKGREVYGVYAMDESLVGTPPKEEAADPLQASLFGTEPHKLSRTADPQTSRDAAHSIDTTRLEELVYDTIRGAGPRGIISDEVRGALSGRDRVLWVQTPRQVWPGTERDGRHILAGRRRDKGTSGSKGRD